MKEYNSRGSNFSLVVLIGPPGVGKGTLAQTCVDSLGWIHISTGTLCRFVASCDTPVGKRVAEIINAGNILDTDLMVQMLHDDLVQKIQKAKEHQSVILLDGFPRHAGQLSSFLRLMDLCNMQKNTFKFVIFSADWKIIKDRLCGRIVCSNKKCDRVYCNKEGETNGRCCHMCQAALVRRLDDEDEIIWLKRFTLYEEYKQAMLQALNEHQLSYVVLDAMRDKNDVYRDFMNIIRQTC